MTSLTSSIQVSEEAMSDQCREALPICQCGAPYSKHGKGTLACPPHTYLAMKAVEQPLVLDEVERVARALATKHYVDRFKSDASDPWIAKNIDGNWQIFADDARTAIAALIRSKLPVDRERVATAVRILQTQLDESGEVIGAFHRDSNVANSIRILISAIEGLGDEIHG